ncbi:unnamed protein product [Tenebrio molitor]|nr:unnamed protein product [Tenebrio molitor]
MRKRMGSDVCISIQSFRLISTTVRTNFCLGVPYKKCS